jgi:hypothetical protein
MAIDQGLPRFTGEESLQQRVKMLQDYQYQLVEQLRYALQNLDTRNMNMDAMGEWGGTLTEPLYASLMDEDGNMLSLAATAKGLSAQISDQNGKIAQISADAAEISTKLWDTETGAITQLQAKAGELSVTVGELAEGQTAMLYVDAESGFIFSNETGKSVQIDGGQLIAGTVYADYLVGESVYLLPASWNNITKDAVGIITITGADSSPYALDMGSYYAMRLHAGVGTLYLEGESTRFDGDGPFIALGIDNASDTNPICNIGACALVLSKDKTSNGRVTRRGSYGYNMPSDSEGVQGQIYILLE